MLLYNKKQILSVMFGKKIISYAQMSGMSRAVDTSTYDRINQVNL